MENKQVNDLSLDYEVLSQAYKEKCLECVKFQTLATKLSIELDEYKNKEELEKIEKDLKQEEA